MAKGQPIDEYKIVSDNLRWYSNMRFAQLTLFVAVTAAIANGLLNDKISSLVFYSTSLKLGGIIVSGLFWYLELRADDYWSHFMKRAVELEKALEYRQYTNRPTKEPRTTEVIRFFILSTGVFWIVNIFAGLF